MSQSKKNEVVYQYVCEMLVDRGSVETSFSPPPLIDGNHVTIETDTEDIQVVFSTDQKDTTETIRRLVISPEKKTRIIMVSDSKLNAHATNQTAMIKREYPDTVIENFSHQMMTYNPTKHILYNPHRKLSEDEVATVMKTYNIHNRTQFPVINKNDRIAMHLGLVTGDVVEITHLTKMGGRSKYYRICR